jgi:TldD protein
MNRRKFLQSCSLILPGVFMSKSIRSNFVNQENTGSKRINFDDDYIKKLADSAIMTAKKNGAGYCDFRLTNFKNQRLFARDSNLQNIFTSEDFGFSVRVLVEGAWGFGASSTFTEKEVVRISAMSCEIAKSNKKIQKNIVHLVPVESYTDYWKTPIKIDPFDVAIDEKANLLISINEKAKSLGADFCNSFIWSVNENKVFVSSEGSYIKQDIFRIYPSYELTIINKETGKFENRSSLSAPIGKGYEYVKEFDWFGDVERSVEETQKKLNAKSVETGKRDIILDPTNLWLTIHESCGHPTELDRALGYEANYAGTSFMTVDKLRKLMYGSEHVTMIADRTQKDGLATRGYDDDGVKTTRWELIKEGLFVGYQTTREMASLIDEKNSNGCSYSDSWEHFPIQRMPNVSLKPGEQKLSLNELIENTEDGIYIVGDGSWSIDMQRYNFQFTGQAFHEIKNGKITGILKDVAYQGNTIDFWNSCDAVCDESEYKLGGSFFCGKGEPGQVSPVSHGCSPARFRKINILNTSKEG